MKPYISNEYLCLYLLALGILVSVLRGKSSGQAIVVIWVFYLIAFHALSNLDLSTPLTYGVHERFWMQPNVCAFFFLGLGIVYLGIFIEHVTTQFVYKPVLSILIATSKYNRLLRAQQFVCGTLILYHLADRIVNGVYPKMDQSNNNDLDVVLRATLNTMPKNALILVRNKSKPFRKIILTSKHHRFAVIIIQMECDICIRWKMFGQILT